MANKIKEEDIFDGNIFEQNQKSAEEFAKTLQEILKITQKKISIASPEDAKSIETLNENLTKSKTVRKVLSDVEKENNKNLKDLNILQNKEAGTIDKLTAKNRLLTRERKQLNLETQNGRLRLKEINEELNRNNEFLKENSDKLTQQRLNVGNYTDSINEALEKTGLFGGTLNDLRDGLSTVQNLFASSVDAVNANTEALRTQTGVQQKATASAKLLGSALKVGVIGAVVAAGAALFAFLKRFEEGIDALDRFTTRLDGAFSVLANRLAILGEGIQQIFSGEFRKGIDEISNSFNGFGKELQKSKEEADALFERIDNFGQISRLTQRRIEQLSGEISVLTSRSSDLTLSFADREKAEELLTKRSNELLNARLLLAKEEFEQQKQGALLRTRATKEQLEEAIRTQTAGKNISEDLLAELLEFEKSVIQIENDIKSNRESIQSTSRTNRDKEAKVSIGILKDNAEVEKSILKDVANDSKATFEEREESLRKFSELSAKSTNEQIAVLQGLTKEQINIDELSKLNATELEEQLKKIGLSVKSTNELSDILTQKKKDQIELDKTATKIAEDREKIRIRNAKAEQNIEQDNFKEQLKNEKEFFEDAKEQANLLRKLEVEELERSLQIQNDIEKQALLDQKDFELQNTELTAQEKLDIENKYRIALLDLDKKLANEQEKIQEEARQKRLAEAQRLQSLVVDEFTKALDKETEAQQEAFDKRLSQLDADIERQKELAANGEKSMLAFKEAERAKAELLKQQAEEKAQKKKDALALTDAFLAAYINNLKQPNTTSEQALLKAGKQTGEAFALKTIIGGLYSAKDGAEDTGVGGNVDKDRGFLAVLHPHERVLTKEQNEPLLKMGIPNEILPNLVMDGLRFNSMPNIMQSIEMNRSSKLENKLDKLIETVANKPYYIDTTDKHGNHVRTTVEGAMRRTVKYVTQRPRI